MSDHIGGLIPLLHIGRDRHTMENTWWVELTWFRCLFRAEVTR